MFFTKEKANYQEKINFGMFKIIKVQSSPRSFVRIEVSFIMDAFGKLNVYADKDQINYKDEKKKITYIQDGYH